MKAMEATVVETSSIHLGLQRGEKLVYEYDNMTK